MLIHLPYLFCAAAAAAPAAGQASSSGYDQLFAALPGAPQHIEAALAIRDVQRLRAWAERWRARLTRSQVGRAYFDAAVQRQTLGFDWIAELGRLADLVDPARLG